MSHINESHIIYVTYISFICDPHSIPHSYVSDSHISESHMHDMTHYEYVTHTVMSRIPHLYATRIVVSHILVLIYAIVLSQFTHDHVMSNSYITDT